MASTRGARPRSAPADGIPRSGSAHFVTTPARRRKTDEALSAPSYSVAFGCMCSCGTSTAHIFRNGFQYGEHALAGVAGNDSPMGYRYLLGFLESRSRFLQLGAARYLAQPGKSEARRCALHVWTNAAMGVFKPQ